MQSYHSSNSAVIDEKSLSDKGVRMQINASFDEKLLWSKLVAGDCVPGP